MIRFSCPKCDGILSAPESKAGGVMSCPECHQKMQIPAASDQPGGADVEEVEEIDEVIGDDVQEVDEEVVEEPEEVAEADAEEVIEEPEEVVEDESEELADEEPEEIEEERPRQRKRAMAATAARGRSAARGHDDEDDDEADDDADADEDEDDDDGPRRKKSGGSPVFLLVALGVLALLLLIAGGWAAYEFVIKKDEKVAVTSSRSGPGIPPPVINPSGGSGSGQSGSGDGSAPPSSSSSPGDSGSSTPPGSGSSPPNSSSQPGSSSAQGSGSPVGSDIDPLKPHPISTGGDLGEKVFQRALKSTVFIVGVAQDKPRVSGSGFLIDRKNRLVITNNHVVSVPVKYFIVSFPIYRDGKMVESKKEYLELVKKGDMGCKVLATDQARDLALIQLPQLPEGVLAIKPATEEPKPGSPVQSVGSPGASDGIFLYTRGTVRATHLRDPLEWKVSDGRGGVFSMKARVIETDSATNPGDSGGPLVNNKAELVGVVEGGSVEANSLSLFIAASEVQAFLAENLPKQTPSMKWEIETEGSLDSGAGVGFTEENLPALQRVLKESNVQRRAEAARAIGSIGPKAHSAIPSLLDAIKDTDAGVARAAMEAITSIGAADELMIPELIDKYVKDPDARVRRYTARAIGGMGPAAGRATDALIELTKDTDADVRKEGQIALGKVGAAEREKVFPILFNQLKDAQDAPTRKVLAQAVLSLGSLTAAEVNILKDNLQSSNAELRIYCARSLGQIGPQAKDAVANLVALLKHDDKATAIAAADALGKIGHEAKAALPNLLDAIQDNDSQLSKASADAIMSIGKLSKTEVTSLSACLKSNVPHIRTNALNVLFSMGQGQDVKEIVPALCDALKDQDKAVRLQSARALESVASADTKTAIKPLVEVLKDHEPEVRIAAIKALHKFGMWASADAIVPLDKIITEEKQKPDLKLLEEAVLALGAMRPNKAVADHMIDLLKDEPTKPLFEAVAKALGMTGMIAVDNLVTMLKAKEIPFRLAAAKAMMELDNDLKLIRPPLKQLQQRNQIGGALQKMAAAEPDPQVKMALEEARRKIVGEL
jgi:HEAT repeat protein/S1-C subfamily serine protease